MYLQLNMVIFHCQITFLEGFLVESGQEADIDRDGLLLFNEGILLATGILKEGTSPYLEDHPRTCKWLVTLVSKSPE